MSTTSPEFRFQEIKTRRLEIASTLANWKRDYLVDGIPRARGERATLEAEEADLALELCRIADEAKKSRALRRKVEDASMLAQLKQILTERGQEHLIAEAQQRTEMQGGEA